ncbi:hypothetical protein [Pseudomonas chlororaphis]
MIRSYKDVADVGYDDLAAAIDGYRELRAAFEILRNRLPTGVVEHDLANLGVLHADHLIGCTEAWVADMGFKLGGLDAISQGTTSTAEAEEAPMPHYLLDQRSAIAVEAIEAERKHATRWWTYLNEMRRRKELPEWVAEDIGAHEEHDRLLESRKAVNQALFGSDDLGGDQSCRQVQLGQG